MFSCRASRVVRSLNSGEHRKLSCVRTARRIVWRAATARPVRERSLRMEIDDPRLTGSTDGQTRRQCRLTRVPPFVLMTPMECMPPPHV